MEKRISATRAVRDFSEVLNTIKFKGVHYIIERGGKPIASMKSIDEKVVPMTLGSWRKNWMPLHQILQRSPIINRLCQRGIYGSNIRHKLSDPSREAGIRDQPICRK